MPLRRQLAEQLPPVLAGVPSERNLSRHHLAVRIDLDIRGAIDVWHRRQPPLATARLVV
jgi:hypothetical protein